ncbi:probable chitinase 10 [Neocloeon triangulifer]|uniref:probable chitinase 10 n=1 Tax=Neocloeon triangulifer TaxID=2078957 RepID=UPI00286F5986|nr:probable chitinase 10 [Neocloeon triangulifer]
MFKAWKFLLAFGLMAEVRGCMGAAIGSTKVVVCQYNSWAPYRTAPGNFTASMIDPNLCTHGAYEFASYNPLNDEISHSNLHDLDSEDGKAGGYRQMVELKLKNPNFKPMLGIGGAGAGRDAFTEMAASPTRRAVFTQNVIAFLKLHNFEGLEFDWVSPVYLETMASFGTLLSEMRVEFDKEGLVLSASLQAVPYVNTGLDVISNACHFVVLMTYDYNGPWWLVTANSAPLYGWGYYNVNTSVYEHIKYQVDPAKIVLSVPAYGRSYTLVDPDSHTLGSKASAPGAAGPYTRTPGWISFNELAEDIENWTTERDPSSLSPYSYKGDQWVSHDDEISTKAKVEYVNSMGLAGVAMWSVDEDNFFENFTLLKTINQWLN